MPTGPDHWVEIAMCDAGDGKASFSVNAAGEKGGFAEQGKATVLERGAEGGFLARLSLNGSVNRCTTEVQDAHGKWHEIVKPIPLYLRTTHCEVKMFAGSEPSRSVGWFEDVRME